MDTYMLMLPELFRHLGIEPSYEACNCSIMSVRVAEGSLLRASYQSCAIASGSA